MLQISARHLDKTTILDVSGDIDLASTPEFRKAALRELRELRTPRVLLNLTAVRYIDSSGVASLVEALKASRDLRSRLLLFGLSSAVRRVLQLSHLVRGCATRDTEAQAVAPWACRADGE